MFFTNLSLVIGTSQLACCFYSGLLFEITAFPRVQSCLYHQSCPLKRFIKRHRRFIQVSFVRRVRLIILAYLVLLIKPTHYYIDKNIIMSCPSISVTRSQQPKKFTSNLSH